MRISSASLRRRISRSLVSILFLTTANAVVAPVFLPHLVTPPAKAATLFSNLNNFVQWNTWMGGANHRPYINKTTTQIGSNGDEIKLTSKDQTSVFNDQYSAAGYLWNTSQSTGDFSVTADYWFGDLDTGADAIGFIMRPISGWPNGGALGGTGGSHAGWGGIANEVSVIFDTYKNGTEIDNDHLNVISRNSANVQTSYTGDGVALKDESGNADANIEDGLWHTYTINWNSTSKVLKVTAGTLGGTQYQIASYTISDQTATGYYWGWVGLTGGATSDFSVKNVNYNEPAKFTQHPSSVTTTVGTQVTFSAAYSSVEATPTTAKWQYSTDGGTNWVDAGITATSLTVTASRDITQRKYRYYVSNTAANEVYTTTSNVATLEVVGTSIETDTALTLNGTSQYAWIADSGLNGSFDIKTTLSMEAWVYPTESSAGVQYSVICKSEAYQLFHIDGIWKYSLQGSTSWGTGVSTLVPVELNEWHHIALTRTGSTVNFYYDGIAVFSGGSNTAGTGNINDSSFPFAIGGMVYNGPSLQYGFKGKIDHVAIYDSAITQAMVQSDMNTYIAPSTSNLKFFYDMNKGSESVLYNRTSTALSTSDLALVGSPTYDDVKIESSTNSYRTVKFPRSYLTAAGGWKVPAGLTSVSALIIGGGGGGGSRVGGGGGAGGYLYLSSLSLTAGNIETITVGQGGVGGRTGNVAGINYQGANGANTVFGTRYTLLGGGGGGGYNTAANTYHEGKSGASGGGAAPHLTTTGTWALGVGTSTQYSTFGYGLGNDGGSGYSGTGGYYPAGGGGGAGGAGVSATGNSTAGDGGAGILDPIGGTTLCYASGGGGGIGNLYSSTGTVGGLASTCGGGTATAGSGSEGEVAGSSATANTGSGGGGSGYVSGNTNTTDKAGGHGGSGVVIVKYLIASSKPIFSGPFNDTTTAGLTETFTVTGSPDNPMVRSYQWQVSTDTGTSWATPTQGSGWTTASYVTPVLTTSMSGLRYQYRVIVTDTDTVGARLTETSTAVYLIINAALTVTGSSTINKAINVAKFETYTVTGGTATHRYTLSPTISGITLDTSTALSPVIRISETKTVGTYYETLTVTDSVSASVTLPITIIVTAPPSFSASAEQVVSGTIVDLDPGSTASYIGTGTSWKDLSGRSADASLNYAFGTTATYADGSSRASSITNTNITCNNPAYSSDNFGSFEFTTVGQCIYAINSIPVVGINPVPVYTVSTWLKRNGDQQAWRSIICNPYRNANDQIIFCLFWASATTINAGVFTGGGWRQTAAVTVPNQTWVFASVTYNGSNQLNLYLNDVTTAYSDSSISVTWASAKINTGLIVGRKWDAADTFVGSVGQIRVYDRILSTTEIAQNYNATKSRYLTTFNKRTQSKKYGTVLSDTYTVTSGLNSISVTLASNAQSAIKWDTSTARSTRLSLQESLTVGTYYETVTATDTLGQSVYLPLTFTISKADTLTVSMDTGTVVTYNGTPIILYPKPVYKGLVGVDTLTVTTKFSSSTYTLSSTRPTNADTYTVIASDPVFTVGASSNYYNIIYETSTAVVNKARQAALNPSMYGAVIGSPFTLTVLGGSGDGAVSETLTGVSTAPNCAISNHVLTSSTTTIQYCQVTFTKATSQNYLAETITAQIYFMVFISNQPSGQTGGGSSIGINGATSVTVSVNAAPTITGITTSGDFTYPLAISGAGFAASGAGTTTIKFWRNQVLAPGDFIIKSDTLIWAKQPAGATVGKVLVTNGNGTAVSEANFTPLVFNI